MCEVQIKESIVVHVLHSKFNERKSRSHKLASFDLQYQESKLPIETHRVPLIGLITMLLLGVVLVAANDDQRLCLTSVNVQTGRLYKAASSLL